MVYHPGSTTQIELERTTLQLARRTIDGAPMLGISWNLWGSDDKLQVIIIICCISLASEVLLPTDDSRWGYDKDSCVILQTHWNAGCLKGQKSMAKHGDTHSQPPGMFLTPCKWWGFQLPTSLPSTGWVDRSIYRIHLVASRSFYWSNGTQMDGSMEVQGPTLRCTLPSRILQALKMERIVYPVRRPGAGPFWTMLHGKVVANFRTFKGRSFSLDFGPCSKSTLGRCVAFVFGMRSELIMGQSIGLSSEHVSMPGPFCWEIPAIERVSCQNPARDYARVKEKSPGFFSVDFTSQTWNLQTWCHDARCNGSWGAAGTDPWGEDFDGQQLSCMNYGKTSFLLFETCLGFDCFTCGCLTHEAVDAAVGKTLADFASCFFPWIDKARGPWWGKDTGQHTLDEDVESVVNWIGYDLVIFEGYLVAWSWRWTWSQSQGHFPTSVCDFGAWGDCESWPCLGCQFWCASYAVAHQPGKSCERSLKSSNFSRVVDMCWMLFQALPLEMIGCFFDSCAYFLHTVGLYWS